MFKKAVLSLIAGFAIHAAADSANAQSMADMVANELRFQNQFYNWAWQGSQQVARYHRMTGQPIPFNAATLVEANRQNQRAYDAYNAACRVGTFDHAVLDDCHTEGLVPPKPHWALPLDTPPFYGYTLKPGVTFTYLGAQVNEQAQVHFGGQPSPNLFAAGEVMAGNVLGQGYTAGVGMTIGTVFGRIAGREAARAAA